MILWNSGLFELCKELEVCEFGRFLEFEFLQQKSNKKGKESEQRVKKTPCDHEIRWLAQVSRCLPPKAPLFRLRLEMQLQSLQARLKTLSVNLFRGLAT